jgi:glycosyltransferase involved in cell wall biosynthesis
VNSSERNVAVAFHEAEVGGASLSVLRILPLLEQRGWKFIFWTPGPGTLRAELERAGHRVAGNPRLLRYSWNTLRMPPGPVRRLATVPGYLSSFRAWIRAAAPSILHANTLLTIPEALAARGTGCATLLYVHEILPKGFRGSAAAALARASADAVIGNSQATVLALQRRGVPARLNYNGVRLPDDAKAPSRDGRLVIGTLGTVSRRKGSDLFLAAARRLQAKLPSAEFRMIGPCVEGPERSWAVQLTEAARGSAIRCGARSDPLRELRDWDVFVLPSRDEPFGLAVAEAMALGIPVVATRVGGLPEVVGGEAGLLVEPEDVDALVAAILDLARDPLLRSTMGVSGRARVKREFTLEKQADGVHRAYLEVARSV